MSWSRTAWDFVRYARVVRFTAEYAPLAPDYLSTSFGRTGSNEFDDIHTCVLFIGIGRSGTTLIGSLLDAHPNMVVANEQGILKYLHPISFSREQLFELLLRSSARAREKGRPGGGGYHYAVPGQWQGRYERIRVIGDKTRSAQAVEWLHSRPELLEKLAATARAKIRLLHVIRNPFDTIARRSMRRRQPLERMTREYFGLADQLMGLLDRVDQGLAGAVRIPVHLEQLISAPAAQLESICRGLGVTADPAYLEACAGIVYGTPSEPRQSVDWPSSLSTEIQSRIRDIPYLAHYSL